MERKRWGKRESESDERDRGSWVRVERKLDLEISGSRGDDLKRGLERNRFVVRSCKVVKRKAKDSTSSRHRGSRGSKLTVGK